MVNLSSFNRIKTESGFTFIEIILYTALISIFLTSLVYFAWDIIYGQIRSNVEQEVAENIRIVAQRIQSEVRNAEDIITVAPTSLELNSGALGITTIFLDGDAVKITQSGVTSALTSDEVEVTVLSFSDRSTEDDSSKNIEFSLSISHKNPEANKEWEKTDTLNTSVELRSN